MSLAKIIGDASTAQTTSGSTQATAAAMVADHVHVADATQGEGIILREGDASELRSVSNGDQSANFYVYPPVGSAFNGATTNAPIELASAKAALFVFVNPLKINAIFS